MILRLTYAGLIISLSLLLSSCYQDIDMDKYRKKPVIVLNSIASPDTVVMASVSRTVFFTDYRKGIPIVTDAMVRLTVNGQPRQTMRYDSKKEMYLSDYRPKAGDTIRVEAVSDIGTAVGEDVVPEQVPIQNVQVTYRTFDDPDQLLIAPDGTTTYGKAYEATYYITFSDRSLAPDYYCIRIEQAAGKTAETLDYSHDEVFLAQRPAIDGATTDTHIYGDEGRTFSDELFNGKTYTLKIVEKGTLSYITGTVKRPRRVLLYTLSKGYYNYLTGILNEDNGTVSNGLVNIGFAEPSAHYSNITGGTGIMGAVQCSVKSADWAIVSK